MATIPTTSKQSASTSSGTDEENKINYETNLSAEDTHIEINMDTSTWSAADKKKLQHMTEFHQEYQCVFGEEASIRTIMKRRKSHMNPPMPKAVCEEEMQSAQLDNNEVIIEYITDVQGNKVKKLKPIFIKSEPDRDHTQHVDSDVPKDNFTQKREIMVDSYSESISSDDDSSNDRTITAESDSSAATTFKETPYEWEADPKGIEATLHQIAAGFQSAAEGYLTLASHISKVASYELPQVVVQIPPPPVYVPMPIRKDLLIDGESKVLSHLIHGEYELTNTSYSKLQKKYCVSRDKVCTAIKGRRRPRGSQ